MPDNEFEKALKKFFLDRVIVNPDTKSQIRQHFLEIKDENRQQELKSFSTQDWLNLFAQREASLPGDIKKAIKEYTKFSKK